MPREKVHRAASATPGGNRHRLTSRDKPTYKVVLEQVTQQKKKLIVVGSSQPQPPSGYTFIPAGDPQITNRCKHLARLDGLKVYVVSTTRHKHKGLSNQVHRIGYHFPSSVVARACMSLGIDLSRDGHVLHHQPGWTGTASSQTSRTRSGKRQKPLLDNNPQTGFSQATIDTQAREAIKDLFPKIPQKDLHEIVTHAFELGTARVGTAPELSLPRRVQLAVVAHIRHSYTDYDKLLKEVPYQVARAIIEQPSLDKLAQWRGDDDDDPDAMEEILREVIVIPDDDDEASNPGNDSKDRLRYSSVEMLASRTISDDVETRPIDYAVQQSTDAGGESPESDDVQEVTFLGHGQYALDRPSENQTNRNGVHRLRAWKEARERTRHPLAWATPTYRKPSTHLPGINNRSSVEFDFRDDIQQPSLQGQRLPLRRHLQMYEEVYNVAPATSQTGHAHIHDLDGNRKDFQGAIQRSIRLLRPFSPPVPLELSQSSYGEFHRPEHVRPGALSRTHQVSMANSLPGRVSNSYPSPPNPQSPHLHQLESPGSPSQGSLRFERILQSVETPSHMQPARPTPHGENHAIPASHINPANDTEMHGQHRMHNAQNSVGEGQQTSKRRRLDIDGGQPLTRRRGPGGIRETLMTSMDDNSRHGVSVPQSVVVRRVNDLEPTVRSKWQQAVRPQQRVVYLDQGEGSKHDYFPGPSDRGLSLIVDSPRHRQFLISSPQHSSLLNFPAPMPVKLLSKRPGPQLLKYDSMLSPPYGPPAPYVSLPRDVIRASDIAASHTERRVLSDSALVTASHNTVSLVGDSRQTSGHWIQREASAHNRQDERLKPPGTHHLHMQPYLASEERPRRNLPLDRPLEELRPTGRAPLMHDSIGSKERDFDIQEPEKKSSSDSNLGLRSAYRQQDLRGLGPQESLSLERNRQGFESPYGNANRFHELASRPNEEHYLVGRVGHSEVQDPYLPMTRVPKYGHETRKVFDSQSGRELIILE